MNKKGILIVISGFSGAGKGTLVKALLNQYEDYVLSVSATTRKPRQGELDGREYFFKTREEFEKMLAEGEFIEYAEYVNHYYGTPSRYVCSQLEAGKNVILEIEIQGARKVKERFPEALLLFVTPPSAKELKKRLTERGTEDGETIRLRLKKAAEEAKGMSAYDYLIVNDNLEECVHTMHEIIISAGYEMQRNKKTVENIAEELRVFSEGE